MDNSIIVNSIKSLCKNRNITVSQLEKEIGLSQGLVSKWLNTTPSLDKIVDIADYFHVSIDEVVCRKSNINDDFINELYEQTANRSIAWENCETMKQHGSMVKQYTDFIAPHSYIGENEKEISYAIRFNSGYIVMYAYHRYDQIVNPFNLILFIQPTDESFLVDQHYTKEELYSLWIKILNSLGDNAPDEIKAEDLKTSFINEFRNKSNDSAPKKKKKVIYVSYPPAIAIEYVLKKSNGCILYDITNNKIIDQDENIGITDIGKNFYITHKASLGDIKQAKMFNGKDLVLLSSTHIMKLSGFSSGEQHGNIGYDGLLNVLKDAGFDVSNESIIDKENFTIDKLQ